MTEGPFPLDRLPRVATADAERLRALHALYALFDARGSAEAEALLGTRVAIEPGVAELLAAGEVHAGLARAPCLLVLEERSQAAALTLACDLPVELAARLVDRVLGGDGEAAHPVGRTLDDLSAGVLAYLAARVCSALGAQLRVAGLLTEPAACAAALGDGPLVCLPATLALGDRACGALRLLVPEATRSALARRPARPAHAARTRPELPVTLCAHAARTTLTLAELRALAPGDAVVPERCELVRDGDGWTGSVGLHALGSSRVLSARARGRELVAEGPFALEEPAMPQAKRIETSALDTQLAPLGDDTPIAVCLELARFTLPLGELAALRKGDVLDTGHTLGAQVTLTAGGHAIALGELIDLDGDLGVRVLELKRAPA